MIPQPEYFKRIREGAAKRWDQLEQDPELAGPWHQLFKQVQSPRHILSELLQNADDAGATEASVHVENGVFVFKHNGEDFTAEHFASLCRFGYSNKRALHTIGFRGIGFKSTFSLGDRVELFTPSLSVVFDRHRFTEPVWTEPPLQGDDFTVVRVVIREKRRQKEVERNLQEWLKSPVSLLFFKSIRRLAIQDEVVEWKNIGPGPVENTEWVELVDKGKKPFLLVRSAFEQFPEEALSEIKEERMLTAGEDADFPPCQVELVLGAKGRLFVVLPTGVETTLPFACNAPFIQDPARMKIKDPETSPTNRWLLERVGKLATSVMLRWLKNDRLELTERAQAYALLPNIDRDDSSLEGICATTVEEAFDVIQENKSLLLTNDGDLKPANQSVIIPKELLDVWPADQVATLMDDANRPIFSLHVSNADREKLVRWGIIEEITRDQVLIILQKKHLPKPESWERLLKLWVYIASELTGYRYNPDKDKVRIVPVKGKEVLYSVSEVIRLGERKILQSSEEWEFLATYLLVFNNDWSQFLADQRRKVKESENEKLTEEVEIAYTVLRAVGIESSSDASQMVERVSTDFFSQGKHPVSDCIKLAQIAAKVGATVRTSFRFVTQDTRLRSTEDVILFDEDGTLEYLLPSNWGQNHLLHSDYSTFSSCTEEEWTGWISSGRAGLFTFVPPLQKRVSVWGRQKIDREIRNRGYEGNISFHYVTDQFAIDDWDFEGIHWRHWQSLAKEDDKLWGRLVERILAQQDTFWSKAISVKALHIATTGTKKSVINGSLTPDWILKLRGISCLPDTRGFYRKPAELVRRTPETEPFMDVEPFIHGKLDNESNRQLLDMLGVSSVPMGPERLLDCLQTLSRADEPPVYEVDKWYRRLDLMADTCSTADFHNIKNTFYDEKLILTEDTTWVQASDVFLSTDEEDVPGVAVVRASVRDLVIWRKMGIPERPTVDLVIKWLQGLPSGKALSQEDARRVRALLARHALRIWDECGHWLNLAGEWVPVDTISYALTMQSLVPWSHLHKWVKQKTVDFHLLGAITQEPPFSEIPTLASHIEERFHQPPFFKGHFEEKTWLKRLGSELCRLILDDEDNTARIRALAEDLVETKWQTTGGLETIPYIEGTPAGTPRSVEVLWLDRVLYVDDLPNAKLARKVPEKLGKFFNHQDINAALNYCYGRSPEDVTEYIEENFELLEIEEDEPPVAEEVEYTIVEEVEPPVSKETKPPVAEDVKSPIAEETEPSVAEEAVALAGDTLQEGPVSQDSEFADVCPTEAQAVSVEKMAASDPDEHLIPASEPKECESEIIYEELPSEVVKPKKPHISKSPKMGFIGRFAQRLGYKKNEDESSSDGLPLLAAELEDGENGITGEEPPAEAPETKKAHTSKPNNPSIIERFAQIMGYKKDGDKFYHADGSFICKSNDSIFSWEMWSASGELVRSYWPKDHCLQMEPLQLDAEVWGLVDRFPQTHAFILSDPEGEPVELTGESLRTMREEGEITLYPATYRIVYEPDQYNPDRNTPQNLLICANEE